MSKPKSGRGKQFQLNFSWNLFGKMSKHTQIQTARLGEQLAEIRWQQAIQKSKEEYFSTSLQIENAYSDYIANTEIYEATQNSHQIAQQKYEAGLITLRELSNVTAQLQAAEINRARSLIEWQFTLKMISFFYETTLD
jgi:outer membrane protein TolC